MPAFDTERLKNLLQYYIECLREDEGQPIRFDRKDEGRRFIPWPFPSDLWSMDTSDLRLTVDHGQRRFSEELKKTSAGPNLRYGYPVYVEASRRVIPILTWAVDHELHGVELWLQALPEWPQLNSEYLKRFARTSEEQSNLLEELGLLDTTSAPPDGFVCDVIERMEKSDLLEDSIAQLDPSNLASLAVSSPAMCMESLIVLPSLSQRGLQKA